MCKEELAPLQELIDRLLERFCLADAQHRMTREYSEGMARKLAIACALLGEPSLLVLDESLAGLDPRAAADVRAVVQERAEAGAAVLFVSHQLEVMERLCDRVILIDNGRVTAQLTPEEFATVRAQESGLVGWYLEHT